MSEFSGNAGIS